MLVEILRHARCMTTVLCCYVFPYSIYNISIRVFQLKLRTMFYKMIAILNYLFFCCVFNNLVKPQSHLNVCHEIYLRSESHKTYAFFDIDISQITVRITDREIYLQKGT